MRKSSFLVDTEQSISVGGRFSLPSDIHRSIINAYFFLLSEIFEHRKWRETCLMLANSTEMNV